MKSHIIHIQKWTHSDPPSEEALFRQLSHEGLKPYKWHSAPQDVFPAHEHPYEKVIVVVAGTITFGFPIEGDPTTLYPGDRLDLPAGVTHNAAVGREGVVCLEAQRSVK